MQPAKFEGKLIMSSESDTTPDLFSRDWPFNSLKLVLKFESENENEKNSSGLSLPQEKDAIPAEEKPGWRKDGDQFTFHETITAKEKRMYERMRDQTYCDSSEYETDTEQSESDWDSLDDEDMFIPLKVMIPRKQIVNALNKKKTSPSKASDGIDEATDKPIDKDLKKEDRICIDAPVEASVEPSIEPSVEAPVEAQVKGSVTETQVEKEKETFKCDKCMKLFKSAKDLEKHEIIHKEPKLRPRQFKCFICNSNFRSTVGLQQHVDKCLPKTESSKPCKSESDPNPVSVDITSTKTKEDVKSQENILKENKRTVLIPSKRELRPRRRFKCFLCPYSFGSSVDLEIHVNKRHLRNSKTNSVTRVGILKLNRCDELVSTCGSDKILMPSTITKYNDLEREQSSPKSKTKLTKQPQKSLKLKLKKPFQCFKCSNQYWLKSDLSRHLRLHHTKQRFKCSVCSKNFKSKNNLGIHMNTHTGETPFKCADCPKAFRNPGILYSHYKFEHGNIKPAKYTVMSKKSDSNEPSPVSQDAKESALLIQKSSTVCSICQKSFSRPYNLKQHIMRIHNKTQRFECSICSKQFYRKARWKAHESTHTVVEPDIPSQAYPEEADFKNEETHKTDLKSDNCIVIICQICDRGFDEVASLQSHIASYHHQRNSRKFIITSK